MAFLIGIVGAVGTAYLVSETKEWWDKTTKPIYDKIEKENKDSEERIIEQLRQERVSRTKNMRNTHDTIRRQYNIKKHGSTITLVNNCEELCYVVFVNHYSASNKDEAVTWAKKCIDMDYFDGQVLNKTTTKKITIGCSNEYDIIKEEIDEYFVVLCIENTFIVLDDTDKYTNVIKIRNRFDLKSTDVYIGCKAW